MRKMAYEHKDGSGTLFRNDQKSGNQPDYRGGCCINGRQLEMAAWIKEGKSGKFLSFKFQEPQTRGERVAKQQEQDNGREEDIPW